MTLRLRWIADIGECLLNTESGHNVFLIRAATELTAKRRDAFRRRVQMLIMWGICNNVFPCALLD